MKTLRAITVLLVVAACVALAGVALASKGSKPARQLPNSTKVHKTTPPEQSSEANSESSGDTESGQPGEPAQGQGHEDPAGQDANHECTGNCQE